MNVLERAKTTSTRVEPKPIVMTHVLPPHPQLDIRSSEAQSPIQQMDQQQPHIDSQQQPQAQAQPPPPPGRKRKKAENGEPLTPAEPRRLRRSHEACARCRSKKIKVSTQASAVILFLPCARRGKSRRSTPPAISFLALPLALSYSHPHSPVRFKTPTMHRLRNRRYSLSPGRQAPPDPHPSRSHRTS